MMNKTGENILDYIELDTGSKAITPMNDVFLNYTFEKKMYWETLRKMTNIFYEAYMEAYADTKMMLIEGEITVKTQFPYFKNITSSMPKEQDIRIKSNGKIDFVEFQNDMRPKIPIATRSIEYFGYSLTRGKDRLATTMWLLKGTVEELLNEKVFSNYVLMDEQDHQRHPFSSSILYVDLKKLARNDTRAGELAGVLIGTLEDPKNHDVNLILMNLKRSFNEFKDNTEVRSVMTRAEQLKEEGKEEERAKLLPLLTEKEKQIAEKEKHIAELEALLASKVTQQI